MSSIEPYNPLAVDRAFLREYQTAGGASTSMDRQASYPLSEARQLQGLLAGADVPPVDAAAAAAAAKIVQLVPPDPANPDDRLAAAVFVAAYSTRSADWGLPPPEDPSASRNAALRWLGSALECQAAHDPAYQDKPHFWLITNARLWPQPLDATEPGFARLKGLAADKLVQLGRAYERDVYEAMGLGALLGSLGAGLDVHPRQDTHAGLCFPKDGGPAFFQRPFRLIGGGGGQEAGAGPGLEMHPRAEGGYVYFLSIAALVLDPFFQHDFRVALVDDSDAAQAAVPPKGFMRMQSKKNTDHLYKPSPKAAENVDTNRAACVRDVAALPGAYARAEKAFGIPLRVKNNYSPAVDALSDVTRGYRCILANYLYSVPGGKTWGDLGPEIEDATAQLKSIVATTDRHIGDSEEQVADRARLIDSAAACFSSAELGREPARLVVEIQFMTTEYWAMRKHTHTWYKTDRAQNPLGLMYDYIGGLD